MKTATVPNQFRPTLAAIVAQVPHVSGPAAVRSTGLKAALKVSALGVLDLAGSWLGRAPVLVDSVTTWVAALMDETGVWGDEPGAAEQLAGRCDALVNAWTMTPAHVVAVSDEVGLGVVPETRAGRLFRDTLGSVNQRLAATADEVWFVVAGLPQRLR